MPRAPRACPGDNYECPNLIAGGQKYCPDHTKVWAGRRTSSSQLTGTAAWQRLRKQVLKRDNNRCQARLQGCTGHADQVDHIISIAAGGAPLEPANCQAICTPCNARKAQAESRAAIRRTKRR